MKIVTIAHRNSEMVELQRKQFAKHHPEAEHLVAANEDHELEFTPDLIIPYGENDYERTWPFCLMNTAKWLLDNIDGDIVVAESDMILLSPIKSYFVREWAGRPYYGLMHVPADRSTFDSLPLLPWKSIDMPDEFKEYETFGNNELIGDNWLHITGGETAYKVREMQKDATNEPLITADEQADRISKCSACKYLVNKGQGSEKCLLFFKECGCSGRHKTRIKSIKCPVGMWAV